MYTYQSSCAHAGHKCMLGSNPCASICFHVFELISNSNMSLSHRAPSNPPNNTNIFSCTTTNTYPNRREGPSYPANTPLPHHCSCSSRSCRHCWFLYTRTLTCINVKHPQILQPRTAIVTPKQSSITTLLFSRHPGWVGPRTSTRSHLGSGAYK